MKQILSLLNGCFVLFTFFSMSAIAAEGIDNRACNMQGREIALRVSEEVSTAMSSDERSQIAAIAEEVCLDFVTAVAAPIRNDLPVISRPDAAQAATPAAPVAAAPAESADTAEEEDDEGLFGNIRIIDSKDRVQRPGLKRP